MAQKSVKPGASAGTGKRTGSRARRAPHAASSPRQAQVFRAFLRFAAPHTTRQFLTLALAVLGAFSILAGVASRQLGGSIVALDWGVVLALLAGLARIERLPLATVGQLTMQRLRLGVGFALLLSALILATAAMVGRSLAATAVPLLGPLSQPGEAYPFIGFLFLLGAAILFVGAGMMLPLNWILAHVGSLHAATRSSVTRQATIGPIAEGDGHVLALHATPLVTAWKRSNPVPPDRTHASPELRSADVAASMDSSRALPPIDLFVKPVKGTALPADLDIKARTIEGKLASFGVGAQVVAYHCGPTVTLFDVEPHPGVKVRRITELQNDLALALAAPTIRIQAPVPGRPVVGIEIPNSSATTVTMREILESEAYHAIHSPLRVAMGKGVAGAAVCIDLAAMPHLLIAGATGSGKSVCLNVIISCLLYRNTPEDVRLLMVDPKMVELTVYNGVPHLLSPVVTEVEKVVGVLRWTIREMERRYALFRDASVRNVARYNARLEERGERKLPYIVLIIDELADLMMIAPDDVEESICRLAQLARATGIHLVLATQRPSVDVITGLIKANFPARIAFAMSSQVDSRTILDQVGAEKLLGRGDMLYQDPGEPKPVRLQGAYLSDREIERLVEFWQGSTQVGDQVSASEFEVQAREAAEPDDQLLNQAIAVVRDHKRASVSLLQRRLSIGRLRAARLMDLLEEQGVVGVADGGKSRPVLDTTEQVDGSSVESSV